MAIRYEKPHTPHLTAFIEEYFSCIKAKSEYVAYPRLAGYDFFIRKPRNCKQPQDWHLVLHISDGRQQYLADSNMNVLCRYDDIMPLFNRCTDPALEESIFSFMKAIRSLEPPVAHDDRCAAGMSLYALCDPTHIKAQAYLVKQNGLYGVVDPFGKELIKPKYQNIRLFAFRERCFDRDFAPRVEADADLYLCTEDPKQLNSTDVFDMDGNCIFSQISSLYPYQQVLTTDRICTEACESPIPTLWEVKTVWINIQHLEHPYPDEPSLEVINDDCRKYSVAKLRSAAVGADPLLRHPVRNSSVWRWDTQHWHTTTALKQLPPNLQKIFHPMVALISERIGRTAVEILRRLPDYWDFRDERTDLKSIIPSISLDTTLDELELTVRCYNVLRRAGIQTVGKLLNLTDHDFMNMRGMAPKVMKEIDILKKQLIEALSS